MKIEQNKSTNQINQSIEGQPFQKYDDADVYDNDDDIYNDYEADDGGYGNNTGWLGKRILAGEKITFPSNASTEMVSLHILLYSSF